jgi:hypothetical protein
MKQNNNNRRARGRGPRKPHGMGGGHNKGQGFENPGHETRVRGNAYQVLEKYLQLARDAGSAGDRVAAENFLQHADHYYRVLSAMNDGQRPRIGGRELSVADVNVQNVSQGLSAAMYGSSQGLPGMSDSGAGDDGQDANPGNQAQPHQGGHQGNQGQGNQGQGHQGQSHQGQGHQGQERHERGQRQDRGQDRGQDRNQDRGQDRGQDRNQGQRHNQGRQNQPHQSGQHQSGQQRSGESQQSSGNAANGHNGSYGNYADEQPQVSYAASEPASPPPVVDEQPDYPEELLPNAATAAPAPEAPEAAPEGQPRARNPRGRLRSPGRRKPAEGAAGGTEPSGE